MFGEDFLHNFFDNLLSTLFSTFFFLEFLDIHLLSILYYFVLLREISLTLAFNFFTDLKNSSAIKILILSTLVMFECSLLKDYSGLVLVMQHLLSLRVNVEFLKKCLLLSLYIFHLSCPFPPLLLCFSLLTFLKYLLTFGCAFPLKNEVN